MLSLASFELIFDLITIHRPDNREITSGSRCMCFGKFGHVGENFRTSTDRVWLGATEIIAFLRHYRPRRVNSQAASICMQLLGS